jgi:plasmid stabilization system protein ParE
MIVVITADAEADLERIGDAIAQHNPTRAITLVRELRRKCETLALAPRRFALIPRYEHTNIRRVVHGNYLIFYRVSNELVEVVHILHGAMNFSAILFPDD